MNPPAIFLAGRQNIESEVENSTIEKQRKELHLLIGELKDRDKELNDMVAVHQRQLLSWEEDRQKVLTLEERCSKLEGELQKRTEIIKSLMKKVKVLESNQIECQTALRKTQLQLQEMVQKATHSSLLSEDLEVYVKQQSDLQFLNFNVENSQELIQIYDSKMEESKVLESSRDMCLSDLENNHPKVDVKREKNQKSLVKDQKFEAILAQQNRSDKNSCDICKEKKLQINTAFGEKNIITVSSLLTKDLAEKQKSWSLGGKIQIEPENKITLCKSHAKSAQSNGIGLQNEEKQGSETSVSLPDEKQWHDVSVYLGLANSPGSKQAEKLEVECHEATERSEISCCPKDGRCLGESELCESKCCHPSNLIIEAPGHMSDAEWMNIFKPSKVERIVRHKTVCTCSGSGTKCNSSASEFIAIQHSHCLGSKSAVREGETEALLDKKSSSTGSLPSKDAAMSNEQDDCSPTSKLQRLLAESRQMVTDLELSTLLPISSENLNSSDRSNLDLSEESAQKNTIVSH